jgi:hypothetical protein
VAWDFKLLEDMRISAIPQWHESPDVLRHVASGGRPEARAGQIGGGA